MTLAWMYFIRVILLNRYFMKYLRGRAFFEHLNIPTIAIQQNIKKYKKIKTNNVIIIR